MIHQQQGQSNDLVSAFVPPITGILQRKCACGQSSAGGECSACRKKSGQLQRSPSGQTRSSGVPPVVNEVLGSEGRPLDAAARRFMESRFNRDFSQVRVHTDTQAANSAQAVDALAYTVGNHIVFNTGQYFPHRLSGQKILAHELTHVAQQNSAGMKDGGDLHLGSSSDGHEREANEVARQVTQGESTGLKRTFSGSPAGRLQRLRRQDTHAGLFEMTRHRPVGGPTFSPAYSYDVRIEFLPYRIVDCSSIVMTQTAVQRVGANLVYPSAAQRSRALTAAEGTEGVTIDRLSGRPFPYYGSTVAGGAGANAHFGSRTGRGRPDRAWIEDAPGALGTTPASSRTAGTPESMRFETCAICRAGRDQNAYYGCVSWGFSIDAANRFTQEPFGRVSKGTPSTDFLAAARKWNAQVAPVATTDLPIPGHATHNPHMTRSQLDAEIRRLQTRRRGLAPGHADLPQITFELRVLRDIRQAIQYNEDQGYLTTVIRMIQARVGAREDGIWGYDTIRRIKIWQARHRLVTDGRVGPRTLSRMGIHRAGDYPTPDTSPTATRDA